MKIYYLPFTTQTIGFWQIPAESLEEAKALASQGFPYQHSIESIYEDTDTFWDVDRMTDDLNLLDTDSIYTCQKCHEVMLYWQKDSHKAKGECDA